MLKIISYYCSLLGCCESTASNLLQNLQNQATGSIENIQFMHEQVSDPQIKITDQICISKQVL